MKKIIIKEIYNDDNYMFYESLKDDLQENFYNDIILYGNCDYNGINDDLLKVINNELYEYSDYELEVYYKNHYASFIIEKLKPYKKINLKQALEIMKLLKDDYIQRENFFIKVLNIMFSGDYKLITLRGYNQRDWIVCCYNQKKVNFDYIQYIEACFFNTGITIWISDGLIDDNDIDIDNIENQHDGYYDYMVNYFLLDDKKSYLASITGYEVDQLKYFEIKDAKTYTTTKVFYKEGI